jgi:hypothetical protein
MITQNDTNSIFLLREEQKKDMLEHLVVSYLSTIIQNKDLAMLKWRHGSSISVEVGVCRWVVTNEKT